MTSILSVSLTLQQNLDGWSIVVFVSRTMHWLLWHADVHPQRLNVNVVAGLRNFAASLRVMVLKVLILSSELQPTRSPHDIDL